MTVKISSKSCREFTMMFRVFFLIFFSFSIFAGDKISILSPHRKSLEKAYISLFKKHYKKTYGVEVDVDWIDQGGTENNIRLLSMPSVIYEQNTHENLRRLRKYTIVLLESY